MPNATNERASGNVMRKHFRHRVLSGLALLVPAAVTWFVLSLVYRATVGAVTSVLQPLIPNAPYWAIATLSLAGLVVMLYVLGSVATNVFGRRLIGFVERFVVRIPLLDSIYGTSKQIVEMFRSEEGVTRRRVVLVPFPHQDTRVVGFLTSNITLQDGNPMATVFVPSTPNPTTGFLQFFPVDDIIDLDWNTDEAIQFIMSGGLIHPNIVESETPE